MGAQPKLKPFCQSFVFFPFPFDLLFPFPLASANVTMQRATLWRRFPWQPPKHRSFSRVPTFASGLLHWCLVPLHSGQAHSPCCLLSGMDIQSGKPTAQLSVHPYPCLRAQEKNGELITTYARTSFEGREGVKWELGFAFFRGWEMGFCALGLGFMKNNRKMGMGFQFEQLRLGLWDLSWDLKKNNFLRNGIRNPPSRPYI